MKRQWDTKKQFEPDYCGVAKIVFLGWLKAATYPAWGRIVRDLWDALVQLLDAVFGIMLALVLLISSPLSFPLLCLAHRMTRRRKRLNYIRRNRAADADI